MLQSKFLHAHALKGHERLKMFAYIVHVFPPWKSRPYKAVRSVVYTAEPLRESNEMEWKLIESSDAKVLCFFPIQSIQEAYGTHWHRMVQFLLVWDIVKKLNKFMEK